MELAGEDSPVLGGEKKAWAARHPLAPRGAEVFLKYGDEHYPEHTIPPTFTLTNRGGRLCRYVTSFLLYNKRGERLVPLDCLDDVKSSPCVLFGFLLSTALLTNNVNAAHVAQHWARFKSRRNVLQETMGALGSDSPYAVRILVDKWRIDFGARPEDKPFIWLVSVRGAHYRLERPAQRYAAVFGPSYRKFEVVTRFLKAVQQHPRASWSTICNLLCGEDSNPPSGGTQVSPDHHSLQTPWGGGPYQLQTPPSPQDVLGLGDFILAQARLFAAYISLPSSHDSSSSSYLHSFLQLPALQQLERQMKPRHFTSSALCAAADPPRRGRPDPGQPEDAGITAAAPDAYGHGVTVMVSPQNNPYTGGPPAGFVDSRLLLGAEPADSAGFGPDEGAEGRASACYESAYGAGGSPVAMAAYDLTAAFLSPYEYYARARMQMRTTLHVWQPKVVFSDAARRLTAEELKKWPSFWGTDFYASPLVAFGVPCAGQVPPLPATLPLLLPEPEDGNFGGGARSLAGVAASSPAHTTAYMSSTVVEDW